MLLMKSLLTEDIILKVLAKYFYQGTIQKIKINSYANRKIAVQAINVNKLA